MENMPVEKEKKQNEKRNDYNNPDRNAASG